MKRRANAWWCCTNLRMKNCSCAWKGWPKAICPIYGKPRPDQFFRVDAFPLLGTGKLDLRKVRETAQVRAAEIPSLISFPTRCRMPMLRSRFRLSVCPHSPDLDIARR